MHIQDFFQNFLKLFLVGLHGDCTISLIAQDMSPLAGVLLFVQTTISLHYSGNLKRTVPALAAPT